MIHIQKFPKWVFTSRWQDFNLKKKFFLIVNPLLFLTAEHSNFLYFRMENVGGGITSHVFKSIHHLHLFIKNFNQCSGKNFFSGVCRGVYCDDKMQVQCTITDLEISKKPWYSPMQRVPYLILHSSLVFTRCQHCLPAFTTAFHRRCQKSFLLNKNIATAFADNFHYELVAHHMHIGFLWAFTGVCFLFVHFWGSDTFAVLHAHKRLVL